MTAPDTRPAITEEQLARLIAAIQRSGASVNVTDSRLTSLQNWILAAVGAGLISAGIWVGDKISDLSLSVALLQTEQAAVSDHEQRLRALERRP